jgi:hypothetical protein
MLYMVLGREPYDVEVVFLLTQQKTAHLSRYLINQ